MSKNFTQAPKARSPSDEAIVAFERGGAGQDTRSNKPTFQGNMEPAAASVAASTDNGATKSSETIKEPLRRLSVDLPESLHRRFKTACSRTDRVMLVEVTEMIRRRVEELEGSGHI